MCWNYDFQVFFFYAWFLRGIVASGSEILHKNFTLFTKVSFAAPNSDTLFECTVSDKGASFMFGITV